MAGRTSKVRIEAQDAATSVFDRVAQNIGNSLDDLNRRGESIAALTDRFKVMIETFGGGSTEAKVFAQSVSDVGASALETVSQIATLTSGIQSLITMAGQARGIIGAAGAGGVAGALGLGSIIGAAIALPTKYAIDLSTADKDEATKMQGKASTRGLEMERERAAAEAQFEAYSLATKKQADLAMAINAGRSPGTSVADRYSRNAAGIGASTSGRAMNELGDVLRGMNNRGEGFTLDQVGEWADQAQRAAQSYDDAEKSAQRRKDADKQSADLMDRMAHRAADITEANLTKPEKFAKDMNEILELYFGGALGGQAAMRALTKSGIENQPDKKKDNDLPFHLSGNNLTESRFLTRGGGEVSVVVTELQKSNALLARYIAQRATQSKWLRPEQIEAYLRRIEAAQRRLATQGLK